MALFPDLGRKIFEETDVTPPAGLKPNDAYDLALYHELGKPGRAVLVVKTALQLQFCDGASGLPTSKGKTLRWTEAEKRAFATSFQSTLQVTWSDNHRITTTSTLPLVRDIGVLFEIEIMIDGWHLDDHWELSVEKADNFRQSSVTPFTGNSQIDSQDVLPVAKRAGHLQRGAVHEFGHMLGLRDEYPSAGDNKNWTGDEASIMHSAETVRSRHYAMLAHWITEQYAEAARLARTPTVFKVGGVDDLSSAKL